jgi:hypothetical protein
MREQAPQGIPYYDGAQNGSDPGLVTLPRRTVLDRYTQHTRHCHACKVRPERHRHRRVPCVAASHTHPEFAYPAAMRLAGLPQCMCVGSTHGRANVFIPWWQCREPWPTSNEASSWCEALHLQLLCMRWLLLCRVYSWCPLKLHSLHWSCCACSQLTGSSTRGCGSLSSQTTSMLNGTKGSRRGQEAGERGHQRMCTQTCRPHIVSLGGR